MRCKTVRVASAGGSNESCQTTNWVYRIQRAGDTYVHHVEDTVMRRKT